MIRQDSNQIIVSQQQDFQHYFNFQESFSCQPQDDISQQVAGTRFQPHKQQMEHLYWQQTDQYSWKNQNKHIILQHNQQIKKVQEQANKKQIIVHQRNQREPNKVEQKQLCLQDQQIKDIILTQQFQEKIYSFFNYYLLVPLQRLQSNLLSLQKFAKLNKISQKIVFDLYQKWVSNLVPPNEDKELLYKSQKEFMQKGVTNRQQFLESVITKNPLLSLNEVTQIADKQKNLFIISQQSKKLTTNYYALKKLCHKQKMKKTKLGLISSKRNLPQDYQRRKLYAMKLINLQQIQKKIVFLDQMTINNWTTRDRAWTKENQYYSNVMTNLKRQSFLLVSIMNQKGAVKFQIIHGSITKARYEFIINRLLKYANKQQPGNKALVIHEAVGEQTRNIMESIGQQRGFQIVILPPFSSKLNPLEYWFCQVRDLLKLHKYSNENDLINAVRKILFGQLKMKPLPNYYLISQLSLKNALNQQPL